MNNNINYVNYAEHVALSSFKFTQLIALHLFLDPYEENL